MARHHKTDKKHILEYLREVPIKESACKKAGVSHATFYRWLKRDKQFALDVRNALIPSRSRITDMAESRLIEAVNHGEPWAIRYWLNNNTSRYNAYSSAKNKAPDDDEQTELVPVKVMGSIRGPKTKVQS